jgi:serine/threonine protein phosphatase 1
LSIFYNVKQKAPQQFTKYMRTQQMRTLVIGDIHGGLRALQIMERAKVTPKDTLIFLAGDYVDG